MPSASAHPVLAGGNFAFISGEEPHVAPEVHGGHRGLEQLLGHEGLKFEHTDAHYGGKSVPMFIVHGVGRDQAMELGRKLGQESVIFSNAGQHELVYTNGPKAGKYHPGNGMKFFNAVPDDGVATRIPNVGFVRLGFDNGKLLDVPKKGSEAMSDQKTQKSDVSVADFRTALAKSIRNSIESFSKKLEDLAQREVKKSEGYSAVGSFPLIESDLQIGGPICPVCHNADLPDTCTCLYKSVDREKVYHSYKENVASRLFPGDEETQHKLGEAAAKVWENGKKVDGKPEEVKVGKAELCKECGKETCKCMDKGEAKFNPTPGSKTQRRKQNLTDRKRLERLGTPQDVKQFDAGLKNLASRRPMNKEEWQEELGKNDEWLEKKTPPGVSEDKMHAMKDAMTKEYGAKKGKEVAYATAWKQHNAKKSEDFIDDKNANAPPASTEEARKGGKRIKNIGAETTPVDTTKPVTGNIDEGSGGKVEKGKSTKKAEPPMAKPPSGKAATPAAPPVSKPGKMKMPKLPTVTEGHPSLRSGRTLTATPGSPEDRARHALGKAGLPMQSRMNAGDVQARHINSGHESAPKAAAPAAPKAVPQAPHNYSDFMPAGKFTAAGPGLPGAKKSEEVEINFKKSLGNCILCGKSEHAGDCE